MEKITEMIYSRQKDKVFILWDLANFHKETILDDSYGDLQFVEIKNKNTIVVRNTKYEFALLLRWKNHKGILYPA